MRHFLAKQTLGTIAVAVTCCLVSGCYTQLQIKGSEAETLREKPREHMGRDNLTVTTEQPWYERSGEEQDVAVSARFENNGYAPVLLSGCPYPPSAVIEEWDGSEWQERLTLGIVCDAPETVQVMKFEPGDWLDFEFSLRYPGWYRIRLLVGHDAENPTAIVHSNQFLIR